MDQDEVLNRYQPYDLYLRDALYSKILTHGHDIIHDF